MNLDQDKSSLIAQKFSPKVVLHPRDMNRPTTLEGFLGNSSLYNSSGVLEKESVEADDLVGYDSYDFSLRLKYNLAKGNDSQFPTGGDVTNGECNADQYVKIHQPKAYQSSFGDNLYLVTYAILFEVSGYQMVRASAYYMGGMAHYRQSFPLPPLARHEGDWEHATFVVFNSDEDEFDINNFSAVGVFLGQHGNEKFYDISKNDNLV